MLSSPVRRISALGIILLLAFLIVATVSAHTSTEPHKKLFLSRWYQQPVSNDYTTWMTLTSSQIYSQCSSPAACYNRWVGPANLALSDWNNKPTTIRVQVQPDQNALYDLNLVLRDSICCDPRIQGETRLYDSSGQLCNPNACTVRWVQVFIADGAHTGSYATEGARGGTIAHEFGHAVSLAHEDNNYPCGMDSTGPIPHSIMQYNCVDPIGVGGRGEYQVQDWDVCGVNHAYYDPTIGYAGCAGIQATPTSSPPPTQPGGAIKGDADCNGQVQIPDSIQDQIFVAGLNPGLCVETLGNVDCTGSVTIFDSIDIQLHIAGLPVPLPPGCSPIGSPVNS